MKKIIFTIFALIVFYGAKAQSPCIPDSIHYPGDGIHPDSLPHARAGVAYSQVIQFRFPTDTQLTVSGSKYQVHIYSAKIKSVFGLPASFAYQCSDTSCTYKSGKYGCLLLTGNPVASQVGKHVLQVNFLLDVHVTTLGVDANNVPDSGFINFTIDAGSGIFYGGNNSNIVSQNFPNPFNVNTEIQFNTSSSQPVAFKVTNELGQQVYVRSLPATQGLNSFTFERNNLPSGMYFYSIQMGNDIVTRRMVIKD
jgi:hypothetical protein